MADKSKYINGIDLEKFPSVQELHLQLGGNLNHY